MKQTNLTSDFLAALIGWQAEGMRAVKIEIEGLHDADPCTVWVYDYELTAGNFVTCKDELPSKQALLKKQQARLEDQRQRLLKQLNALEV